MHDLDLGETVVLAFEGDTCDAAVCVPAVDMCEQALFAVCSAATDAMALVARPLQVIVAKQLRGAATATADLMTFMLHKRTDPRNVAALAGVVWQYCTNINAMKLDDKVCALFHRLFLCLCGLHASLCWSDRKSWCSRSSCGPSRSRTP